jgi:hypothetical protein
LIVLNPDSDSGTFIVINACTDKADFQAFKTYPRIAYRLQDKTILYAKFAFFSGHCPGDWLEYHGKCYKVNANNCIILNTWVVQNT